jgi:hypothetical protein
MENMDVTDEQTPTGGDRMDNPTPPKWFVDNRQPQELSYTEKVRGSSPFAPTQKPPFLGVFGSLSLCELLQFQPGKLRSLAITGLATAAQREIPTCEREYLSSRKNAFVY